MIINPTFLLQDPTIIQGLLNGTLTRYGGVIRETATGQIVRHLVESPALTSNLMTFAANPYLGAVKIATDAVGQGITIHKLNRVSNQINQVQQMLNPILGLSQIAAGASVLNVGISAVGFAYMGYKLHQIQNSLGKMQQSMEAGFKNIDDRLDVLSGQLAYLHLLVQENRQGQIRLAEAINQIHRTILIKVLMYSNVEYWSNLGYGNWGKRISMRNSPRFRYGYDPRRILVGDIDGDGLDDIVYVDDKKVILWINQSGNSWSEPIEIKGTPPVSDLDAVRLVDLLGTGIVGILWSADANGLSRNNMYFLDFTGGVKPYLLNQMDNQMGSLTRVGYTPSIQFYLEDEKQRNRRWQTPLPFPVQTVGKVEVIDRISQGKLTTEYKYHYGYWDGAEREFRGFGMVEQCDTETFADYEEVGLHGDALSFNSVEDRFFSPPTLTKTWFHQGAVGDEFGEWQELVYQDFWQSDPQVLTRPLEIEDALQSLPRRTKRDAYRAMRGQVLRAELYALDGTERADRPYTVTEALPGVREEVPPEERNVSLPDSIEPRHIFFAFGIAQRTTQWERGDEPMTQFGFTEDYDRYGQPRSQISIAIPRIQGEPYFVTQGVTEYAQKDTADVYIVDRPAKTTGYEIINDGSLSVTELKEAIAAGTLNRNILSQTLNYYDGEAFIGLPFGELGNYGAIVKSETLILTEEILQTAYQGEDTPSIPTYLDPNAPAWTDEYPPELQLQLEDLPGLAGYTFHPGDEQHTRGYFVTAAQNKYDFQEAGDGKGLLLATRHPLGKDTGDRDTSIIYDDYDLLPVAVTDPLGLTATAIYDYRVLQPRQAIDPNGNRTAYSFTPLGLMASSAILGKEGESTGDSLAVPSSRLEYDFLAFTERQQPISVRTIQREHHLNETDVVESERDATIETIEYSDGFGRLLQTRTQAEDVTFGDAAFGNQVLPRQQENETATRANVVGRRRTEVEPVNVVVSGWQIYDNKGRVVEQYEPFYDRGWDYAPPQEEQYGQKATMYYDPRGQVIRTVNPDGSEQRVIYGIPEDLTNPEQFTPKPWEAYTYDANDNAGRTHGTGDETHWNTPASIEIDALGRTIKGIARNGANREDWYETQSTYDIRGNLLTVTDALERVAFSYIYDLANNPLQTESIDAGLRRIVLNAVGNEIERRDSKGALILAGYDIANRPLSVWARDDGNSEVTLRERMEYGDGSTPNQPETQRNNNRQRNSLGQLTRYYDEAGLLEFENYDFKGNLLAKVRRVISDESILSVFNPPPPDWSVSAYRVNWQQPPGITLNSYANTVLAAPEYRSEMTYDALNRVKVMRYPQDVEGNSQELRPQYNRAGALEGVKLDNTTYVEHIAYNAKGQRTLIAYGNGVITRYAYDPQTFRLVRLRTEKYNQPDELTYRPTGATIQDFAYQYDLVGNITAIQDRTPASGILNNPQALETADTELARLLASGDALIRRFTYDPIYRLLAATGRECDQPPETPPWVDAAPRCVDLTRTRSYTERYQYDEMGNVLQLQHQNNNSGFTRSFDIFTGNNQLVNMRVGRISTETNHVYTYDDNGNIVQENIARHFEWDHSDQMKVYRTQTVNAEPSVHAHYLYDGSGQRVKKLVRKQGGEIEVTVYIDGVFEERRLGGLVRSRAKISFLLKNK